MKKIITLIVAAALVVGSAGCNKNKPDNVGTEMVGQWELTGAEFATRSITAVMKNRMPGISSDSKARTAIPRIRKPITAVGIAEITSINASLR